MVIVFKRNRLKVLCDGAIVNPKFKRDYYGPGKTACNMASSSIARDMGCNIRWMEGYWKERGIWITSPANAIYENALKEEVKGNIKRVPYSEAQRLAWDGEVVILTAKSEVKGKSGHIAVVYPTRPGIDALKVCNVGWVNLICPPDSKDSFGGGEAYLTEGIYFHIPKEG
jgi:hypothetical protein